MIIDMNETRNEEQTVEIVRSVRFVRLLLVGAVIGGVLAVLVTLTMPMQEGSLYTMGQISGFMLVFGAVIGMAMGGVLGLILNLVARKKVGRGEAVYTSVTGDNISQDSGNSAPVDEDVQ